MEGGEVVKHSESRKGRIIKQREVERDSCISEAHKMDT